MKIIIALAVLLALCRPTLFAQGTSTSPKTQEELMELGLFFVNSRQNGVVERVLKDGLDINHQSSKYNNITLLHLAIERNYPDTARLLLDRKADMYVRNGGGFTSFELAVSFGFYELAEMLLSDYKYDINTLNALHQPALYKCAMKNDVSGLRFLFAHHADPNIPGIETESILHDYVSGIDKTGRSIDPEVVKIFLQSGFDPNKPDGYGYTLAHTLTFKSDLMQLLDGYVVDLNAQTKDGGYTPLVFAAGMGNSSAVQYLLGKGVDPNYKDPTGRTALFYAIMRKQWETTKMLLDRGAILEIRDSEGKKPEDYANEEFKRKMSSYHPESTP